MEMDRPVRVRSDASAADFWCRTRASSDVRPDFTVQEVTVFVRTPFGRQTGARCAPIACADTAPPAHILRSSRSVERREYRRAVEDMEDENVTPFREINGFQLHWYAMLCVGRCGEPPLLMCGMLCFVWDVAENPHSSCA